jgi:hypothetical protein
VLDRFNEQLWRLTRYLLADYADFADDGFSFTLHTNPFPGEAIHPGPYRMGKGVEDANTYRVGHPLAQRILDRARTLRLSSVEVTFDYTGSRKNIAVLEPLRQQRGWLVCVRLTINALEAEDLLLLAGLDDNGVVLDDAQCRRLFDLPASSGRPCAVPAAIVAALDHEISARRQGVVEETTARSGRWFDTEMDKLDRWAEDRRASLRADLAELDENLKDAKRAARLAPTLPEKLERQRAARVLEARREEAWRAYDQASRDVDRQKDSLLDEIGRRLEQRLDQEELFALRWQVM